MRPIVLKTLLLFLLETLYVFVETVEFFFYFLLLPSKDTVFADLSCWYVDYALSPTG